MQGITNQLDMQTEMLIAIGAAVACGCQPCLHKLVDRARSADISPRRLKAAAIVGQFVKEQPAGQMKALADELLGTHLGQAPGGGRGCPMEEGSVAPAGGCGCT